MILRTKYAGAVELRSVSGPFGNSDPPPRSNYGLSWTGQPMGHEQAAGVVAFYAGVRLIAETIALMPLLTYRRDATGLSAEATNAWQYDLLLSSPNDLPSYTAFNFFEDVVAQIEGCGNAFALKFRNRGRISELYLLDPDYVKIERDGRAVRYLVQLPGEAQTVAIPATELLHFRGPTLKGGVSGVGAVTLHRNTLGIASALDEFQGRFFENDARPGVVLKFPEKVTPRQAREWAEQWDEDHRGVKEAHRTAVMGAGGDIATIPISLSDAQFLEAMNHSVEQVGRMLRIPRTFSNLDVGTSAGTNPESELSRLIKVTLLARMKRIEQAINRDTDLFGTPDLYSRFKPDELLRADNKTRYESYWAARKGGWLTANEIRDEENRPPHENGDVLLETPVGAGANQAPAGPAPAVA